MMKIHLHVSPLCNVCEAANVICEQKKDNGLNTVTRTILVGYLMKATSNCVKIMK